MSQNTFKKKYRKAYDRGVSDANAGRDIRDCPFGWGTPSREAYEAGYKAKSHKNTPRSNEVDVFPEDNYFD
jgi:hypothetical protein